MLSFIHKNYAVFFLLSIFAIVSLSFYLGYQQGSSGTKTQDEAIVFSCPDTVLSKQSISSRSNLTASASSITTSQVSTTDSEIKGRYVGSKNGTKYYTPGCSGTNRIKPENYVWFQSVEDATLQGYTKGSC